MNTEEIISSQETERGSSDIEKELSVHLASKHTKYSEIEADESYYEVADDVIEGNRGRNKSS